MVTQNGVPILQPGELVGSVRKFRKLFADGACYVAAIPTYVGGHMAMGWATDNPKLRHAGVKTIADALRQGRPVLDPVLDARGARGGLRAAALHRRTGGESPQGLKHLVRQQICRGRQVRASSRSYGSASSPERQAAFSAADAKFSSISTLFGSLRKICQRGLSGT